MVQNIKGRLTKQEKRLSLNKITAAFIRLGREIADIKVEVIVSGTYDDKEVQLEISKLRRMKTELNGLLEQSKGLGDEGVELIDAIKNLLTLLDKVKPIIQPSLMDAINRREESVIITTEPEVGDPKDLRLKRFDTNLPGKID